MIYYSKIMLVVYKRMVRDTYTLFYLFEIYWNCIASISNIMPVGYGGG